MICARVRDDVVVRKLVAARRDPAETRAHTMEYDPLVDKTRAPGPGRDIVSRAPAGREAYVYNIIYCAFYIILIYIIDSRNK